VIARLTEPGADNSAPAAGHNEMTGKAETVVQAGSIAGGLHLHTGRTGTVVPWQLPTVTSRFVGRQDELDMLSGFMTRESAVRIVVVDGTAGIGKTTLALHWGHLMLEHFPDGQLYLNLRGFDPAGQPMDTAAALRTLLDSFGVSDERLPRTQDGQAGLFRSLTAGRRMLVVLDNAADDDQVQALLPGSPACITLVTSRNRLDGLSVLHGARRIRLSWLTETEGGQLLGRHVGPDRMAAESDHAASIVGYCGGLPLALSIVGARAATQPGFPLELLAGELVDAEQRLGALGNADSAALDMRAVFSWSVLRLQPDASRLFRLLGLHPGSDIGVPVASALTDKPAETTRRLLNQLTRAHLVEELAPGRYTMHDLLKTYAAQEIAADGDPRERENAVRQALDCYLDAAFVGSAVLEPTRRRSVTPVSEPRSDAVAIAMSTDAEAMAWFDAEYANLMAIIMDPVWGGHHDHVWRLAWTLVTFIRRRARWQDSINIFHCAVKSANQLGDVAAAAHSYLNMGRSQLYLGQYDDALANYTKALECYVETKDRHSEANAVNHIGQACERKGDFTAALDCYRRALTIVDELGDTAEKAVVLNNISWSHSCLERFEQAVDYARHALEIQQNSTLREGRAHTLDSLGYALAGLGRHDEALLAYEEAITIFRNLGHRHAEAITHINAATACEKAGDVVTCRLYWDTALTLCVGLDLPEAEKARARLRELDTASPRMDPDHGSLR
jgi:tetratricopeptide (TPR) repeat protein